MGASRLTRLWLRVRWPLAWIATAATGTFAGTGEHRSAANASAFAIGVLFVPLAVRRGWWLPFSPPPMDPEALTNRIRTWLFRTPWLPAVLNAGLAGGFYAYHWRNEIGFWPVFALLGAVSAVCQQELWRRSRSPAIPTALPDPALSATART